MGEGFEGVEGSDLILSKGTGYYEVLEGKVDRNIVFALRAKCLPIASRLGVDLVMASVS